MASFLLFFFFFVTHIFHSFSFLEKKKNKGKQKCEHRAFDECNEVGVVVEVSCFSFFCFFFLFGFREGGLVGSSGGIMFCVGLLAQDKTGPS